VSSPGRLTPAFSFVKLDPPRRLAHLPRPRYPDDLPVVARREEIARAIRDHQVVIVSGETGSGKTTQIPKICLELGRGVNGLIGHTQPRRIAARTVAARIAQELESPLGHAVGYKVRFSDRLSADTYIKLMTDGILLAETQGDRLLHAYDTIIIDEAHERSLNIDFLLGYLKRVLPRRQDLKVIVTSATIETERFSKHFDDAPIIEVSGRTYPVELRYRPLEAQSEDEEDQDIEEAILDAVDELAREKAGDILVFLPGEREIRDTAEALRKHHPKGTEILPLYARLSFEEQERVFKPSGTRRIVLATNVAETSLTVPGIRYVVDTGAARVNRYSWRNKVEQLQIEKISKASANQRAGRCGRVAPGICIRLYSEDDYAQRPEYTEPEILRSSLASVILRMKSLRIGDVEDFPFLEAPAARMIADGYQLLAELGAVDEDNRLTQIGWQLAKFPIDPRIARMILAAEREKCLPEMLVIASALSIQDPRERPFDRADAADRAQEQFQEEKSDFMSYLKLWSFFEEALKHKKSNRKLTELLHEHFLSHRRMREWRDIHGQLAALVGELRMQQGETRAGRRAVAAAGHRAAGKKLEPSHRPRPVEKSPHGANAADRAGAAAAAAPLETAVASGEPTEPPRPPASYEQIHRALLAGLLGNIGSKSEDGAEYYGARGIRFAIFPGSALRKSAPKWVVAAELTETTRLYARCVARIAPEWIEPLAARLVQRQYFDPHWSKSRGMVMAYERVTLYGLTIVPKRLVQYGPINPLEAREIFIHKALAGGDFETRGAFFEHNRRLVRELRELENKARRRDVLVDEETIYGFYDERIPAGIYNAAGFERWRREAEEANPEILHLTREYLMRHAASSITESLFPDALHAAGAELALRYRFEPGHPSDGVTATVPLHLLNQLEETPFDWLVPGFLREKVTWCIRALPKNVRRQLFPLPEQVNAFLESVEEKEMVTAGEVGGGRNVVSPGAGAPVAGDAPGRIDVGRRGDVSMLADSRGGGGEAQTLPRPGYGERVGVRGDEVRPPFELALRRFIQRRIGEPIPEHPWQDKELPAHLRMNFRVVDDAGRELAIGRDLLALKGQLGQAAQLTFSQSDPGIEREGIRTWDFGDLPEKLSFKRGGRTLTGYPALVDEGSSVAIRLFDLEAAAQEAMRAGVRRLLRIALRDPMRQLEKGPPGFLQAALQLRTAVPADALRDDLLNAISDRAFIADDALPRTQKAFEAQRGRARTRLPAVAEGAMRLLTTIAADYQRVAARLASIKGPLVKPAADIRAQLARLIHPGFFSATPWDQLAHLPRYLKAMEVRLDKYGNNPERDAKHTDSIAQLTRRLDERIDKQRKAGVADPRLDEFRWHLEELRVSLFAQELKTPYPVSYKRLEKIWNSIR
jgi:ATP-dependent helicase HrpA